MKTGTGSLPLDWERLARATAHPLRVSILEILGMDGGRTLSPSDLSQELQIPLSNTNYHVTELAKAGLIELFASARCAAPPSTSTESPPPQASQALNRSPRPNRLGRVYSTADREAYPAPPTPGGPGMRPKGFLF